MLERFIISNRELIAEFVGVFFALMAAWIFALISLLFGKLPELIKLLMFFTGLTTSAASGFLSAVITNWVIKRYRDNHNLDEY